MNHASLFSGIGGFDLAAEWMGWNNVFQVEIDPFCTKVLEKNFPNAKRYGDIKQFDGKPYRGAIDILTGGFPCQTFSLAGKGALDLSLWKEMFRIIREVKPRCVVAENVFGIIARKGGVSLETVYTDLENEGFECLPPVVLPACSKGAPHRRDRVWIIAYSYSNGRELQSRNGGRQAYKSEIKENKWQWLRYELTGNADEGLTTDPGSSGLSFGVQSGQRCFPKEAATFERRKFARTYPKNDWSKFPTVSPISARDDGLPGGLVRYSRKGFSKLRKEAIKGSGNAISPQVVYEIFKAIDLTTPLKVGE
jgi:DNA (cytosine-5)-methyltransferase 1